MIPVHYNGKVVGWMDAFLEWSSEPAGERWCDVCHATQYAWALLRITPEGVGLERFVWDCLCVEDEVD